MPATASVRRSRSKFGIHPMVEDLVCISGSFKEAEIAESAGRENAPLRGRGLMTGAIPPSKTRFECKAENVAIHTRDYYQAPNIRLIELTQSKCGYDFSI